MANATFTGHNAFRLEILRRFDGFPKSDQRKIIKKYAESRNLESNEPISTLKDLDDFEELDNFINYLGGYFGIKSGQFQQTVATTSSSSALLLVAVMMMTGLGFYGIYRLFYGKKDK